MLWEGEMLMDTKMVSAVLISVMLGGAIGFGASYVVLSFQINSLQDELSKTKDDMSDMTATVEDLNSSLVELLKAHGQSEGLYFFIQDSNFSVPIESTVFWGVEAWNSNPDSLCEIRDGNLLLFYNGTIDYSYGNSGVFQGQHTDGRTSRQLLVGSSPEVAHREDFVVFPRDIESGQFWLETRFRVNRMGFNCYPTVYDPNYSRINLGITLMCAINNDPFTSEARTLWLDVYFAGYYLNTTGVYAIPKEGHYMSPEEDIHAGYFVGEVSPLDVGQWAEMRVDLGDYIGKTLDLITAVDVESIRVYGFILFVECLGAYAETEYDYATTHV
jgi:hypothetical protein